MVNKDFLPQAAVFKSGSGYSLVPDAVTIIWFLHSVSYIRAVQLLGGRGPNTSQESLTGGHRPLQDEPWPLGPCD